MILASPVRCSTKQTKINGLPAEKNVTITHPIVLGLDVFYGVTNYERLSQLQSYFRTSISILKWTRPGNHVIIAPAGFWPKPEEGT